MRDPKRIKEVLKEVERIWNIYPDLRFWQLICLLDNKLPPIPKFYQEDDETLEELKNVP